MPKNDEFRLLENEQTVKILKLLKKEGKLYMKTIQDKLKVTNYVIKPILYALYCTGHIEKEQQGQFDFYKISKKGETFLQKFGGDKNDEN